MIGKSFRGCILYCLQDKKEIQQKQELVIKGRAEILLFNKCYGNAKELIKEFDDVRRLNPKLAKPVLHIALSLAPGEKLPNNKLTEICQDCAHDLGFENYQFIAVQHKDTRHQHIHIVVNRIGFDGKTLSDSNNYKKIADHCRRMEKKFGLKEVLNPNRYLSKELREVKRLDERKQKLKVAITACLSKSKNYKEFEAGMNCLKYDVIKARGIAFRDAEKVYTKGSEVGFSLSNIEKTLKLKPELREESIQVEKKIGKNVLPISHESLYESEQREIEHEKTNLAKIILKPEEKISPINYELLKENRKRRRRQKQGKSI